MDQSAHGYGHRERETNVGVGESDVERTLMTVASGVVGNKNNLTDVSLKFSLQIHAVIEVLMKNAFTSLFMEWIFLVFRYMVETQQWEFYSVHWPPKKSQKYVSSDS